MADSLSDAIIELNAELDLPTMLNRFLEVSLEQTHASYAAINVLDESGNSVEFYFRGMEKSIWESIGRGPSAVGVLGRIPSLGTLVVDEVTEHPSFRGLPPDHPPLGSFLGTALRARDHVFGYLYLASKEGGFSGHDETVVRALAAAASVAIDNSTLYSSALERERWLAASQDITTTLLADPGDEAALGRIVESALELGQASAATLVLPGLGDEWVMEFTVGTHADEMLGLVLPDGGRALEAIHAGQGTVALEPPGEVILEPIRDFGPALYAPLRAEMRTVGLLMLWRERGRPPFADADLATAQLFADQAALALSIAELRHIRNVSALHEDRKRIADDLHDLVSQELFAAAMQLEHVLDQAPEDLKQLITSTIDHVGRAQRDVRGVVSSLADERAAEPLTERVRREIVLAQPSLGLIPDVRISQNGIPAEVEADSGLADDVVAVIREGLANVARHAHATSASVAVAANGDHIEVVVTDDGVGPPAELDRHSGTANLANRSLRRAGTFSLEPGSGDAPKRGSVMRWTARWRDHNA